MRTSYRLRMTADITSLACYISILTNAIRTNAHDHMTHAHATACTQNGAWQENMLKHLGVVLTSFAPVTPFPAEL
eukprot:829943-Pelagomonas_calceolata.AAC.2